MKDKEEDERAGASTREMHEQKDRGEVERHLPTSEAPELVLRLQLPLQLEPAMPKLEEDVVGEDE